MDANYLGWSRYIAPVIMGVPRRPELGEELAASFCRSDPAIARALRAHDLPLRQPPGPRSGCSRPPLVVQCSGGRDRAARGRPATSTSTCAGSELVLLDATGHCPNLSAPEQLIEAMSSTWRTA